MPQIPDEARAYLDALQKRCQAALDEAARLDAQIEGFRAALKLLGEPERPDGPAQPHTETATRRPGRPVGSPNRRPRRSLPQLIERELAFSGVAMSTSQIAKAIDSQLRGTRAALQRLEQRGRVARGERDLWELLPLAQKQVR